MTGHSTDVPPLYEGDMALTKEQVQALEFTRPASQEPEWDEEVQTRGSLRNPRQLWPNGIIPFVISPEIGIEKIFVYKHCFCYLNVQNVKQKISLFHQPIVLWLAY